jgi:hypothetical protein
MNDNRHVLGRDDECTPVTQRAQNCLSRMGRILFSRRDHGGENFLSGLMQAAEPLIRFVRAGWGSEKFAPEPTSVENEMSVIQYAVLCGDKIVLTGDAGRDV